MTIRNLETCIQTDIPQIFYNFFFFRERQSSDIKIFVLIYFYQFLEKTQSQINAGRNEQLILLDFFNKGSLKHFSHFCEYNQQYLYKNFILDVSNIFINKIL
ncbi:hypothetical protein pb186bvf_016088 [Paramecium bursaria]